MKQRGDRPITEQRHAHTVYLVDEVWEALERMHLEARLRSSVAPSKIEFIEEVLRAGMRRMSSVSQAGTSEGPTGEAGSTTVVDVPARPSSTPAPAQRAVIPRESHPMARPQKKVADSEAAARPAPRRRASPVERLLQASEPGRPAPIRSVAATDPPEE